MIDGETKHNFLKELAKSGNVYFASMKVGIHRDSHYRWKKEDKEYAKLATLAEKRGRENNCDVAEHALMINVKDKKMEAIKYLLSHNSKRYKPKQSSYVLMEHKKAKVIEEVQKRPQTFEDLLYNHAERKIEQRKQLLEEFKGRQMPLKPNGQLIEPNELLNYEAYIRNWFETYPSDTGLEETKS